MSDIPDEVGDAGMDLKRRSDDIGGGPPNRVPFTALPPPDSHASMPPPRGGPTGMGVAGAEIDVADTMTNHASHREMEDLNVKLSSYSNKIEFKVNRILPDNLPGGEMGWGRWIQLAQSKVSADDIEDELQRRYGGGKYEVCVRSVEKQSPQQFFVTISLAGPWIPQTMEGSRFFQTQYGYNMPLGGGALPAAVGATSSAAVSPGQVGVPDALGFAFQTQQLQAQREKELDALRMQQKGNENDLLLKLVLATVAKPEPVPQPKMSIAEIVAAVTGAVTTVMALVREATGPAKIAEERRHQELVEMLKTRGDAAKSPTDQMAATQAILDVYKEHTKMELGIKGELLRGWLQRELKNAGVSEQSGIWAAVEGVVKDVGPEMARTLMAGLANRVANTGTPPPRQPALPGAPPPPPPPPQQRLQPPAPIPAGKTVWGDGQEAASSAAPAAAPPPPSPAEAPAQSPMSLEEQGLLVSYERLNLFMSLLRASANPKWRPKPGGFWNDQHQASSNQFVKAVDLIEACPRAFRERLEDEKSQARTYGTRATPKFASLCFGIPVAEIQAIAADIDALCVASPEADQYLAGLLYWDEQDDPPAPPADANLGNVGLGPNQTPEPIDVGPTPTA